MSYSCPLSFESLDTNISRVSSLFVSSLIIYYMLTFNIFVLYFLFADFMLKLFCAKHFSLIYQLSKVIKSSLKLNDKFSDSGAKRLAGFFGLFFIILLISTNHLNLYNLSIVFGVIFLSCSLLDAFFNYCLGCKVYFVIKKIYPSFMN